MSHLASWYRRNELHEQAERTIARAILEADANTIIHMPHRNLPLPGDSWRLRGIPVVGVHGGVGGAIPGTKPHSRNW